MVNIKEVHKRSYIPKFIVIGSHVTLYIPRMVVLFSLWSNFVGRAASDLRSETSFRFETGC